MPKQVSVEKTAQLNGHKGAIYAICQADLPMHVFTAGSDGIIARWDICNAISSGALAQVQAPVFSLFYEEETHLLFVGREDGGMHVLDTQSRKELKLIKNHSQGVFSIRKVGNFIYTVGGDGNMAIMDMEQLQTQKVLKISEKKLRGLYYDSDEKNIITAAADGFVRSVGYLDSQIKQAWFAHEGAANTIAKLPDGRLITGGRDARLKIWAKSEKDYTLNKDIAAHNYAIYQIKTYLEQGIFITASRDKTLKIWDMETMAVCKRINRVQDMGHKNSVNDFVFFPETSTLISVSDDAAIMVWNLQIEDKQ